MTLEAAPISASKARAFVRHLLVGHHLPYLVEPVRLVASELATHALVHAHSPFVVTLSREHGTVRLTVRSDLGMRWGHDQVLDVGRCGHGIVTGCSRDWGVITGGDSTTVWAAFDTRSEIAVTLMAARAWGMLGVAHALALGPHSARRPEVAGRLTGTGPISGRPAQCNEDGPHERAGGTGQRR